MRVLKQKHSRLIERVECKKTDFIMEDDSSAKNIMQDVLIHLKDKWSHTQADVTKLLMKIHLDGKYCKNK